MFNVDLGLQDSVEKEDFIDHMHSGPFQAGGAKLAGRLLQPGSLRFSMRQRKKSRLDTKKGSQALKYGRSELVSELDIAEPQEGANSAEVVVGTFLETVPSSEDALVGDSGIADLIGIDIVNEPQPFTQCRKSRALGPALIGTGSCGSLKKHREHTFRLTGRLLVTAVFLFRTCGLLEHSEL